MRARRPCSRCRRLETSANSFGRQKLEEARTIKSKLGFNSTSNNMKANNLKMGRRTTALIIVLVTMTLVLQPASTISVTDQASTLSGADAAAVVASASSSTASEPVFAAAPEKSPPQEPQVQRMGAGEPLAPKLPKVNIFVDKREIKKLLGNDAIIYYVRRGEINNYPLGFSIPVGFNHSDMVFTWQNLGQTNVNYSISLQISNINAVMPPKINITRSGLIPRHEQVFKITLPCSGKFSEEVDVQVLINITGQVGGADEAEGPVELANSNQTSGETELVSHKLAIKRRKICAQQPSNWALHRPSSPPPLAPAPLPAPVPVMPPNQPPARPPKLPNSAPKLIQSQSPPLQRAVADDGRPQSPNEQPPEPPASVSAELHPPPSPPPQATPPPVYPIWSNNDINIGGARLVVGNGQQVAGGQAPGSGATSPLLAAVLLLSLAVSLILVLVVIMGSSAATSSARRAHTFASKSPLDKLGSLLAGSLLADKRAGTPAGHLRQPPIAAGPNKCKSPIVGSLRLPKHQQLDSLTLASGHPQQAKQQPYYHKQCFYNYSHSHNHYQHQQPPTADLLGTGYSSCSSQGQPQHPPPIYHIAASQNPSQTTRLIWNQGAEGYTLDAGAYMPLSSGANRSDSGSVYQTIY